MWVGKRCMDLIPSHFWKGDAIGKCARCMCITESPTSAACASHSPCHPASFRFGIVSLCLWLLGQRAVTQWEFNTWVLGFGWKWVIWITKWPWTWWTVGFWGTLSSDTPTWCGTVWVPRWEMSWISLQTSLWDQKCPKPLSAFSALVDATVSPKSKINDKCTSNI